jgi:hypothetical protein
VRSHLQRSRIPIVTETTPPPVTTAPPARLPWLIALAMSVVANGVLFTQNRTLAMQRSVAQKEATHYKEAFKGIYDKEIRLTQDFTTLYVANLKQLQQAGGGGDRQKALESLDAANFFAGFLSRHSRDGQHLSSAEIAAKLAGGRLNAADLARVQAMANQANLSLDRVSAQLTAQRDQEPGAEPGEPVAPPVPAQK